MTATRTLLTRSAQWSVVATGAVLVLLVCALLAVVAGANAIFVSDEPVEFVDAIDPDEPLDASTSMWSVLDGGDRLWVGGQFTHVGGVRQRNVAALHPTTGELIASWDPDVTGRVEALALSPDGTWLYIGGRFATVDGLDIPRLARIDTTTGEVDPGFAPRPNAVIRSIVTDGTHVWVAGSFTTMAGQPQANLARIDAVTGQMGAAWRPSVNAKAFDLELHDGALYVAGSFTSIDGTAVGRVARLDPATAAVDTDWLPDAKHKVYDLSLHPDGSVIYLAGAGPLSREGNSLRAFDTNTGELLWRRINAGDWQAVVATEDLVYGGSHGNYVFASNDGPFLEAPENPNAIPRHKLSAFDPLTGEMTDWAPHANSLVGVWALDAGQSGLLVGGNFTRINFKPQPHVALFPITDAPPPPEPEGQTCAASVDANGVVHLTWTRIPGENRYIVRRNNAWVATPGDVLSFDHTPGVGTHTYTIRSDHGGVRTTTTCAPEVTVGAPPVGGQTCSITRHADGSIRLEWTDVRGENRWIVRRNGSWLATTSSRALDVPHPAAGDAFLIRSEMGGVQTNTACR